MQIDSRIKQMLDTMRHLKWAGLNFGSALQSMQDQYSPTVEELEVLLSELPK